MELALSERFRWANVANNLATCLWIPEGTHFVETVYMSGTMKGVMFKENDSNTAYISFSSLVPFWFLDFLVKGWYIIKDQELVDCGNGIQMNRFFHYWSKLFVERFIPVLGKTQIDKLVITGMSMGGAMSQCFAYNLLTQLGDTRHFKVEVLAFGSPRVGNAELGKWLTENVTIVNYSVVVKIGDKFWGDPACYFPCSEGYVNNPNLKLKRMGEEFCGSVESDSTDISFTTLKREWSFVPLSVLPAWNKAHQFHTYMDNL